MPLTLKSAAAPLGAVVSGIDFRQPDRRQGEHRPGHPEPDIAAQLTKIGATPGGMPSVEFARFVSDYSRRWAPVVKASGARAD